MWDEALWVSTALDFKTHFLESTTMSNDNQSAVHKWKDTNFEKEKTQKHPDVTF